VTKPLAEGNAVATADAAPLLSELQLDALGELFNLALGEAASAFSTMIATEIEVGVPAVELLTRDALITRLGKTNPGRMCGVIQRFESHAQFETDVMLMFSESGSLELVRKLLGQNDIEQITELEQDALCEIGNVMINACMGCLAERFDTEILGELPGVRTGSADTFFHSVSSDARILVVRIDMRIKATDVSGFVIFTMDLPSVRTFTDKVSVLFGIA
jgi:chemotaxis protein CheC